MPPRRLRLFIRRVTRVSLLTITTITVVVTAIPRLYPSDSSPQLVLDAKADQSTDIVAPIPSAQVQTSIKRSTTLGKEVENALIGTKGTYAVVVKNLRTQESYVVNEHTPFIAASLYKLWIMGTVFEQMKEGKLEDTTTMSENLSTLNEKFKLASDSAEEEDTEISSSVQNALTKMITVSDNNAALLLTSKVKVSTVSFYLRRHGFIESKVGNSLPTTTAMGIALFFEKLWKKELADSDSTGKMLELLKGQKLNGKLPKYIPETVEMAHKTGELDGFSHDAGIVYTPNAEYVIVVLSESKNPEQANERIALVSRAVYDYFVK